MHRGNKDEWGLILWTIIFLMMAYFLNQFYQNDLEFQEEYERSEHEKPKH